MIKIAIVLNGEGHYILDRSEYSYIIAVDGGANYLQSINVHPDLIIGDMDSNNTKFQDVEVIRFPPQKDDTDFKLSIKYVKENFVDFHIDVFNYKSIKRIEHFYANLMLLDTNISFIGDDTTITYLNAGKHKFQKTDKFISFFAYPYASGIKTKGFAYNVYDYNLNFNDNLMISNKMIDDECYISFEKGSLIMFVSEDDASNM